MNVITFPGQANVFQPIGHYVRLGESSYGKVAELHAMGRLKGRRFVVDASKIKYQRPIIKGLQAEGAEVVLDTRVAELSSKKFAKGNASGAPWANQSGPLQPDEFSQARQFNIYEKIAECAVDFGIDAVLAPTHFVSDPSYQDWFSIDKTGCIRLRSALDASGGQSIPIDYLLIASVSDFADESKGMELMEGISGLPFDNLWLRMAMSQSPAGPSTARNVVRMLGRWHNLGRPIVADYMGGLTGEALLSLNAVSGIAHGLGERNSFNANGWTREPKKRDKEEGKGGRATRVDVTSFGKSFLISEMNVLLSAYGGKTTLLPHDKAALPNGIANLREDARRLCAYEIERRIDDIAATPTDKRPENFASKRMREAVSSARRAANLKPKPEVAVAERVDLDQLMDRLRAIEKSTLKLSETYDDLAADFAERGVSVRPMSAPRRAHKPSKTGS